MSSSGGGAIILNKAQASNFKALALAANAIAPGTFPQEVIDQAQAIIDAPGE